MNSCNSEETPRNTGRSMAMVCALLLMAAGGCQQRTAGKLLGRWVGRPDTAAAQALREAEKYGDANAEVAQLSGEPSSATDWEQYDLEVDFNFVSHKRLEMSLADNSHPISGEWRIVETYPTGCMIEVETKEPAKDVENQQASGVVRRRFQVELDERAGGCVGFLLTEIGADRQLGSLYFRRPGQSE